MSNNNFAATLNLEERTTLFQNVGNQSPIEGVSYPKRADTSGTPLHKPTHSHGQCLFHQQRLTTFLNTAYTWWCINRAKHFVLISICPCWSQLHKIIKHRLNLQISIYIIYKHKVNVPKCPVTNPLHRTNGRAIFPTGNHGSSVWHTDNHRSYMWLSLGCSLI